MGLYIFPDHEQHYDMQAKSGEYDHKINYLDRLNEIERLLPVLKPCSHILDLACGTGVSIEALLRQSQDIKIIGVDYSAEMLKRAEERFKNNRSVKLIKANFMQVDFPKESFDLIIMSHATRYIPVDREQKFASKTAGWLKPHGVFLVILHRSPFSKILTLFECFINPLFNLNISMTLENRFLKVMSKYLSLKKTRVLGNKNPFIKFVAVYLQKQ